MRARSQSSHFYAAVWSNGLAITSLTLPSEVHWLSRVKVVRRVSATSQPAAFKTLWGVKVSSQLAYLANIFGALNHMKAITEFGKIFWALFPWPIAVSNMDMEAIYFDTTGADINNQCYVFCLSIYAFLCSLNNPCNNVICVTVSMHAVPSLITLNSSLITCHVASSHCLICSIVSNMSSIVRSCLLSNRVVVAFIVWFNFVHCICFLGWLRLGPYVWAKRKKR